jgi:predicted PurR-regulated permease PerM
LIDNLIYPILVNNRLHLHTVPVFLAIIGGLMVFGGAGIVLGPMLLSMMIFLLELWRQSMNTVIEPVPAAEVANARKQLDQ